jgi:hypothetical protein
VIPLILALTIGISSVSLADTVTKAVYEEKAFEVFRDVVVSVDGVKVAHWATNEIMIAHEAGVVIGYPDRTFGPNRRLTGAEFITMTIRLIGLEKTLDPKATLPGGFLAPSWAIPAVAKTAELNIALPFDTTEPITREMVAYILVKALGLKQDPEDPLFLDYHLIDSDYSGYVSALSKARIFIGFPDQTFRPKDILTRAQAATIIVRALK